MQFLKSVLEIVKEKVNSYRSTSGSDHSSPMEYLYHRQKQALVVLSLLVMGNLVYLGFYRTGLGSVRNWTNRILLLGIILALAMIVYYPVQSDRFRRFYFWFLCWYLTVIYAQTFYFIVLEESGLRTDFTELFIAANNTLGVILILGVLLEYKYILYVAVYMGMFLFTVGLSDADPLLRTNLYLPFTFVLGISVLIYYWIHTMDKILKGFVNLRESLEKTVQKKTQKLRRQRELLKKTEKTAKTGGWIFDIETHELRWTDGTRDIHGVDDDFDPSLDSFLQFYRGNDQNMLQAYIQRCREKGEPFRETFQLQPSADQSRWVQISGKLHRKDGEHAEIRGAIRDITERVDLEDELKEEKNRAQELASKDPLTGLNNRRSLMEELDRKRKRAQRLSLDFSLAIVDLDNFSEVNDEYGHQTGDEVLKKLGTCLKNQVRDRDIPARYGGEEFIIIFPHTDTDEAKNVMERFRKEFRSYTFKSEGQTFSVTCSIGISQIRTPDEDRDELIGRADSALYQAKDQGRDCIVVV